MHSIKRSNAIIGTIVTIGAEDIDEATVGRAFEWFRVVERACSRFDSNSELTQLVRRPGEWIAVSDVLFEAIQFSVAVASESGGAFDLTVGRAMVARGFDRHYETNDRIFTGTTLEETASFRDVICDASERRVLLTKPLILDLGAVAKGLAIDLAAKELGQCVSFSIDAGGDLYLGGLNATGDLWKIGIRHPAVDRQLIETLQVTNRAVCTSGVYERGAHILDPRTATPATGIASVTTIAQSAMLADAVGTAAFVLGVDDGLRFCERFGVDAIIFADDLRRFETERPTHA